MKIYVFTMPAQQSVLDRLRSTEASIEKVLELCKVPSISVGVLHEGEKIYTKSFGYRDIENQLSADENSLYMLASVSKHFLVAAVGILVDAGKMKWADPVRLHVPNFDPRGDKRIGKHATFTQILRHSGGLSNPVVSMLGPNGSVILQPEYFMELVNESPTGNGKIQYYEQTWEYSNVGYGVVALAVERISGMPYAEFIQKELLDPLKLNRTIVTEEGFKNDDNVAFPYAQLDDGSWTRLSHEWTSEKNTPVLAAFGKRSSVNDLLLWCAAIMGAEDTEKKDEHFGILSAIGKNPLKKMQTIRWGHWTRPHNDRFQNQSEYCLGWFRAVMPSCQVSWGSYNTPFDQEPDLFEYILGVDSPKRLDIKHTGLGAGVSVSVHTFPESRSAVIALSNGLNVGDASDFATQILIQELFDLQPRISLLPLVEREVAKRGKEFEDTIMKKWHEHRDTSTPEKPHVDFTGDYRGLGITLTVRQNEDTSILELVFNGREDICVPLQYYNVDKYSYMPTARDEWLKGGWLDWDYYMVGILDFKRNDSGEIDSLEWQWEQPSLPTRFWKEGHSSL
ncbi:beta-lactamase/transpeptidase-like protein [Mytilinidion resinicola]|uniref:Beta-lactamase/transpeptidase-like protein n=1 Tax=Mytilinidion resinicola TaxID=574789 RepID=A0A6A6Y7P0_9PEZI|nr:beta-lactamase/transpeptidase-like protein [Mytilinidion resinicola]KAF2804619.1 beta-lactamase/transpeptidase-like protein [Mytilinidion resinicola]